MAYPWKLCVTLALGVVVASLGRPVMAQEPASGTTNAQVLKQVGDLRKLVLDQQKQIEDLRSQRSVAGGAATDTANLRQRILKLMREEMKQAKGNDFRVYWKNGLRLEGYDGDVKLKIGGRMMYDFTWSGGKAVERRLAARLQDGSELRRGRLYVAGTLMKDLDFKVQFDFAGGDADLKDAYLRLKNLPLVGSVTGGHFKEPFGLEELTSSKYITFLERSLTDLFAPGRSAGFMLNNTLLKKRMTWAAGVFRPADGYGESRQDGEYAFTGRVTGLPWYEDGGRKLIHTGLAYSFRNAENNLHYRERPEAHLSPRFVDTGSFAADNAQLLGGEAAIVLGPFSAQSEISSAMVDSTGGSNPNFTSFYVQGSYFLTGEHRPYSTSGGHFGRVKPKKPFSRKDGGWGAWEVALRYSYLDLNDGAINGGRLTNGTLGLNWYLTPNMRVMWNYIRSSLDAGNAQPGDTDAADIFLMRLQVDF